MTGGAGLDQFYFLSGDTGTDTITDFSTSYGDRLNLSDVICDYTPGVDDITEWV